MRVWVYGEGLEFRMLDPPYARKLQALLGVLLVGS